MGKPIRDPPDAARMRGGGSVWRALGFVCELHFSIFSCFIPPPVQTTCSRAFPPRAQRALGPGLAVTPRPLLPPGGDRWDAARPPPQRPRPGAGPGPGAWGPGVLRAGPAAAPRCPSALQASAGPAGRRPRGEAVGALGCLWPVTACSTAVASAGLGWLWARWVDAR